MKKKQNRMFSALLLSITLVFILSACSNGNSSSNETNSEWGVSKDKPILTDVDNKVVKVYATVNGKYLVLPTRHGLNWVDGKYGNQAVLNAYGNPVDFTAALLEIGGVPAVEKGGDASKEFDETEEGKFIKGDKINVSITWEDAGKTYDINDVMVDSSGKELVYRFGGNYDAAEQHMTGCFMCFDSCAVGIVSNTNQPVKAFDSGKVEFRGNPDILPKDGTPVLLTYSIANE